MAPVCQRDQLPDKGSLAKGQKRLEMGLHKVSTKKLTSSNIAMPHLAVEFWFSSFSCGIKSIITIKKLKASVTGKASHTPSS